LCEFKCSCFFAANAAPVLIFNTDHCLSESGSDLIEADRFFHIADRAQADRSLQILFIGISAHDYDGRFRAQLLDLLRHLYAVQLRHADIREDHVRSELPSDLQPVQTIVGTAHIRKSESGPVYFVSKPFSCQFFVVYN